MVRNGGGWASSSNLGNSVVKLDTGAQPDELVSTPQDLPQDLPSEELLRKKEDDELERLSVAHREAFELSKGYQSQLRVFKAPLKARRVRFLTKNQADWQSFDGRPEEVSAIKKRFEDQTLIIKEANRSQRRALKEWQDKELEIDRRRAVCPFNQHFP